MSYIPAQLRRLVIERAASRCEYCRLAQEGQEAAFHLAIAIRRVETALGRHPSLGF